MGACMPTSVSGQLVVELTAAAPINQIQSSGVHSMEQSYVMSRRVGHEKRRHEDIVIAQFATVYLIFPRFLDISHYSFSLLKT